MNWITYQEETRGGQPNYLSIYAIHHFEFQSVIDIGCGSGNDTVYFVKRGKQVLAIDQLICEDYFYSRIPKKYYANLSFLKENFENLKLPKTDCIVACFSLSFCHPSYFHSLWNEITMSLNEGGILIGNLFGDRDYRRNRIDINTFSKEEVFKLLQDYDVKKWKEQEYIRDSDSTHWHYFDFIAKKINLILFSFLLSLFLQFL